MVLDKDILLAAKGLLRNHGDKAAMECAEMVDRWERRGDEKAAQVWRRIMNAIRDMQRETLH